MSKSAPLSALLKNRSALLQIFVAAVLLALGVNLFASALAEALSKKIGLWGPAVSLLVISCLLIVRQTIPSRYVHRQMEGFVLFKADSRDLIGVPRYHYSERLESYVKGLFAENSAPKHLWDSDPVDKAFEFEAETGKARLRQTEAGKLIVEATEYYVLETLSTHLTDYFNKSGLSSDQLKEFSREDVPDILFKNRFLDTFSRPMSERAAFTKSAPRAKSQGRVISSSGPNGVLYSKFDLILPSGAIVQRISPSSIFIKTSKFKLTISIDFKAFSASLPFDFAELYLDKLSFTDVKPYQIGINTSIEFQPLALLSPSGWEYHAWLDSFLEKLSGKIDSEEFLRRIQWESAATVARAVRQKNNFQSQSAEIVR